jgi:hypothetical protein
MASTTTRGGSKARTSNKTTTARRGETVDVVVVVNHDQLRRGERGTVELTDLVRRRLDNGYLRLAGDADGPAAVDAAGLSAPALGATAEQGSDSRGVLLGVAGSDPVPVMANGGGSDGAGGSDNAQG